MNLRKLLLASVGTTVLFGALVSSAFARNWEISNQRIRAIFTALEFHLPNATTRCALTVEASLHSRTNSQGGGKSNRLHNEGGPRPVCVRHIYDPNGDPPVAL
jgi:hypothetical protein